MSATQSPPTEGQGFVTAKPIAEYYSITQPTVYRWAKEEKIPCIRFEGTIRFDFAAVRAAIEGKESAA